MNQLGPQLLGKGNFRGTRRILLFISTENSDSCVLFTSTLQLQPHYLYSLFHLVLVLLPRFSLSSPPLSTFLFPPAFFYVSTSKNLLRKKKQGILTVFIWSSLQPSEVVDSLSNLPPLILPFPLPANTQIFMGRAPSQHGRCASVEADCPAPGLGLTCSRPTPGIPLPQPVSTRYFPDHRNWFNIAHYPNSTQMRLQEKTAGLTEDTFSPFWGCCQKGVFSRCVKGSVSMYRCSSTYNGVTSQ